MEGKRKRVLRMGKTGEWDLEYRDYKVIGMRIKEEGTKGYTFPA